MKTIREIVIDHAQSALEILERERIDNGLGEEETTGQEVVDYLREKPDHLFDEDEEAALFYAAPELANMIDVLIFQFEHNGDECSEDRAVLDQAEALLTRIRNAP